METLYLLRHGESDYPASCSSDYDRPLSAQGLKDSRKMAKYMAEADYIPDLILCSAARRARETLDPLLESISYQGELKYTDDLYLASASQIKIILDTAAADRVLLVGHNEGLSIYLRHLVSEAGPLGTCCLAVVSPAQGRLLDYKAGSRL